MNEEIKRRIDCLDDAHLKITLDRLNDLEKYVNGHYTGNEKYRNNHTVKHYIESKLSEKDAF